MSRIGHKVINIPAGTTVDVNKNVVTVKGPKGELTTTFNPMFTYEINGTELTVKRPNDLKQTKALHGTTRALLHNMVVGVSEGFKKSLIIVGIGYRAQMRGNDLVLNFERIVIVIKSIRNINKLGNDDTLFNYVASFKDETLMRLVKIK